MTSELTPWDETLAHILGSAWIIPAETSAERLDRKAFVGRETMWVTELIEDGVPEGEIIRRHPGAIRTRMMAAEPPIDPGSPEGETLAAVGARMLPTILAFARGWVAA